MSADEDGVVRMWRMLRRHVAGLIVVVLVGAGFLVQQAFASSAFDSLEADQVAQDATRIRIALDYEVQLLVGYGATNSLWDNSFNDLRTGDRAGFESDFPPADVHDIFGLDGILGVGPDGGVRVGGLIDANKTFSAAPPDLVSPGVLRQLYAAGGEAGSAKCGVVNSARAPYLYCGFPSYRADGSGPPPGGLVFLKALDAANLNKLGTRMNLPVALTAQAKGGSDGRPLTLRGALGDLHVTTQISGADHIALDVTLPTVGGSVIVLEALRPRPIHHTATTTMIVMLVVTLLAGALLLGAMMLLVRRGIRRQVEPLRRTAERVIASGDRSLRTNITQSGEIGALARAVDTMLDALAEQDVNLERATAGREEHMRAAYAERRLADQHSRRRTQEMINETVTAVVAELHGVVEQSDAVRAAADTIDDRVGSSNAITATAVERSAHADEVIGELDASLGRVDDIARMINDVAAQTRLLALNATIEAARAGAAGKGFSVVANEVKSLATTTAQSSGEITSTIQTLRQNAGAMATMISQLSGGIAEIDAATGQVRAVSRQQNGAVQQLNESLTAAIDRIQTMARLTQQLEQRGLPRVPIHGTSTLRHDGRGYDVRLVDISESGMRCVVRREVPIAMGDQVELDVPLGGAAPARLAATVAHRAVDEVGAEIGLQFTGVPEDVAERIHRMVTATLQRPKAERVAQPN